MEQHQATNQAAQRIPTMTRPAKRRYWLSGLTAVMLVHQITPGDCFGGVKTGAKQQAAPAFHIRTAEDHSLSPNAYFEQSQHWLTTNDDNSGATSGASRSSSRTVDVPRTSNSSASPNLAKLRDLMRESFFTETETLKLSKAIEEAAAGDANLAAGAAEFCLLLTETMEMGLNALTAAAFHYCSSDKAALSYGAHVTDIVTDAARLQQLEDVAGRPERRDAENLRHLLLSETKDWRALAIRAGACLHRLRVDNSDKSNAGKALFLYAPLASRMGMHRLKNELEGAAFRILYRRQYEAVHSLGTSESDDALGASMRQVLEQVKVEMTEMLQEDADFQSQVADFQVTARLKEPYSMWKKMLRLGYDHVLQVPDALATRIVLTAKKMTPDEPIEVTRARERALCYYAQTLCTKRWTPAADPRYKDYIGKPKRNGYQSLHYTAQTFQQNQDWTLEVQVRSAEMHQVAEFGFASHWEYKESAKDEAQHKQVTVTFPDPSSDAYLRYAQKWHWMQHSGAVDASPASFEPVTNADVWQSKERADRIRARTERLQPYLQALTDAQSDLAREQVFVFVNTAKDSTVVALPAGACVWDALRDTGCSMAVVNGLDTTVTRQLHNGDIIQCGQP